MARTYKTEGLVLKRINYSEADKILTVFSKHYGKLTCLAKGIRKLTSRKAASLELFNQTVLFLVKGRNLDIVTEAELINSFTGFREDLKKVGLAYQFCELVDQLLAQEQPNQAVFTLLRTSFERLSAGKDSVQLELEFKKQLLAETGFGLPKKIDRRHLNQFIEEIIERRLNSSSLLQKVGP